MSNLQALPVMTNVISVFIYITARCTNPSISCWVFPCLIKWEAAAWMLRCGHSQGEEARRHLRLSWLFCHVVGAWPNRHCNSEIPIWMLILQYTCRNFSHALNFWVKPSGKKPLTIWLTNTGFSQLPQSPPKTETYFSLWFLSTFFSYCQQMWKTPQISKNRVHSLTVQLTAITKCCHAIKRTKTANMYKCNNI